MENLSAFAKLLGEENEKRFRDSITDKLIKQATDDMKRTCGYLIDWEELVDDIYDELKQEVKEKIRKKYMDNLESKLENIFGKEMGE